MSANHLECVAGNAALRFLVDAGADEAVADEVRNYFLIPKSPPERSSDVVAVAVTPALLSPATAIQQSRELANSADTIEKLEAAVRGFDGCALKKTAKRTVFSDGARDCEIMIIGEAPGADEDIQGIAFCGASGKLLDKMLAAIGYDRSRVYISNSVFWRPPGNRQPSTEETSICLPFVERHISLINPRLLILAGGTAAGSLFDRSETISRLRGRIYDYRNGYMERPIKTIITYHPSYLLRQPSQKRLAWQDMLMAAEFMSGHLRA